MPSTLSRRKSGVPSVFAPGENLGDGGIDFRRSFSKTKGSHGACPVGNGMTDPFAIEQFTKLFIPVAWTVK